MKNWFSTLCVLMLPTSLLGAEPDLVVVEDFEMSEAGAEAVVGTSIDALPGWYLLGGEAEIVGLESSPGGHALYLKPGVPVTHVARILPEAPQEADRLWVEFRMRPASGRESDSLSSLSMVGGKIVFLSLSSHSSIRGVREVLVFDGTSDLALLAEIVVDDEDWVEVVFEIANGNWRLHDDLGPVTPWLAVDPESSYALHWFGDSSNDVFLDDLRVAFGNQENPFVTDPGGEGANSEGERALRLIGAGDEERGGSEIELGSAEETGNSNSGSDGSAGNESTTGVHALSPERAIVISAVWGSGSRFADVTNRVRQLLDGETTFGALAHVLKSDPTPGWNKSLTILYEVEGKRHILTRGRGGKVSPAILLEHAADADAVGTVSAEKLHGDPAIISAVYGSGTRFADVSARVCELIQASEEEFFARPTWLNADPTPGWNKALIIVFEVDGKPYTYSCGEGGRVDEQVLLEAAAVERERVAKAELLVDHLQIVSAVYGAGLEFADVTERVNTMFADPANDSFARTFWLESDPAPGVKKRLLIVYEIEGDRYTFAVHEGARISPEILTEAAEESKPGL